MKNFLVAFSILLILGAGLGSAVMAQSDAQFTVSGTYSSNTQVTALSAPGQNFTLNFELPVDPTSLMQSYDPGDDFYLNPINATYTYGGSTNTLNGVLLSFYATNAGSQNGGFFVDYCGSDPTCVTGNDYQWTVGGPQQYTGSESNPILTPSNFSYSGQLFDIYDNTNEMCYSSISGSVGSNVVATPEPSALVLLLAGLAGIALFVKVRG
jgi:hypothetical protein